MVVSLSFADVISSSSALQTDQTNASPLTRLTCRTLSSGLVDGRRTRCNSITDWVSCSVPSFRLFPSLQSLQPLPTMSWGSDDGEDDNGNAAAATTTTPGQGATDAPTAPVDSWAQDDAVQSWAQNDAPQYQDIQAQPMSANSFSQPQQRKGGGGSKGLEGFLSKAIIRVFTLSMSSLRPEGCFEDKLYFNDSHIAGIGRDIYGDYYILHRSGVRLFDKPWAKTWTPVSEEPINRLDKSQSAIYLTVSCRRHSLLS